MFKVKIAFDLLEKICIDGYCSNGTLTVTKGVPTGSKLEMIKPDYRAEILELYFSRPSHDLKADWGKTQEVEECHPTITRTQSK